MVADKHRIFPKIYWPGRTRRCRQVPFNGGERQFEATDLVHRTRKYRRDAPFPPAATDNTGDGVSGCL